MQKGGRRNLLAALAVVPFGAAAYWFGQSQGYDRSESEMEEGLEAGWTCPTMARQVSTVRPWQPALPAAPGLTRARVS